MKATQVGKLLLNHAEIILAHVTTAENDLVQLFEKLHSKHTLTLAINPSLSSALTPVIIAAASETLPWITLRIREMLIDECHEAIETGKADIAVVNTEGMTSEGDVLVTERLLMVSNRPPKDDQTTTISFSEMCQHPLILPSKLKSIRRRMEIEAEKLGLKLTIASEIDGLGPRKQAVIAGLGVTIINWLGVFRECEAKTLFCRPIVDPALHRKIIMLSRQGLDNRTRIAFRTMILSTLECILQAEASYTARPPA